LHNFLKTHQIYYSQFYLLKVQLEKWEKEKEEKEQKLMQQFQKQEEQNRETEHKNVTEWRIAQEEKLKQYHHAKEEAMKENALSKQKEKQKFFDSIHQKQIRLKTELKTLKKIQKDGIPRYDLYTNELVHPKAKIKMSKINEETLSVSPSGHLNANSKRQSLRRYGKGHIEALVHLDNTVSALAIYKKALPSPHKYHS